MINICDSHIHIGDPIETSNILDNSIYKNKYKLYSCLKKEILYKQEDYLSTLKDFFAIPLFFKETSIQNANKFVIDYCNEHQKGIPVLCVDDNSTYNDEYNISIFKEHFLLNRYEESHNRSLYYDFLNDNNGYLLLHCRDDIRIQYVRELINKYKRLNVIVAHLGRDTYENSSFIDEVLESFKKEERVLFDISTIHNLDNVKNSLNKVGNERILFGSDFPFEVDDCNSILNNIEIIKDTFDGETTDRILNKNFDRIKKKVYVKR